MFSTGTKGLILILIVIIAASGCLSTEIEPTGYDEENETTEYQGVELTPISQQRNNAIKGTQFIDRESYRLEIDGMVERPTQLTYEEILSYPPTSKVVDLDCVEGWGFTAKWTGVTMQELFNTTGVDPDATTVIFYSADGYSTSLELDYLIENDIMMAYKLNDITLPPDRGFPLQLVAEDKYGYKWAKWITRIEVTDEPYKGYWESVGYSNNADIGGPAFE